MELIQLIINQHIVEEYCEYYFQTYPRRRTKPIERPIPPSLNQWMVMPRHQMNSVKQKWKEFGEWLVEYNGYKNLNISLCTIMIHYYFKDKRRRDADNYTPKYLFDSFTKAGLIIDDDFSHIETLTIEGSYGHRKEERMEINIYVKEKLCQEQLTEK